MCYDFHIKFLLTASDDYETVSTELSFDSVSDRSCIEVNLIDDNVLEGREELQVSLSSEEEFVDLNPATAVVSVTDTDGEMSLM